MTQATTQTKDELLALYTPFYGEDPREHRLGLAVIITPGVRSIRGRVAGCLRRVLGKHALGSAPHHMVYNPQWETGHYAQYHLDVTVYEMRAICDALEAEFTDWPMAYEVDGDSILFGSLSDLVDRIDAAPETRVDCSTWAHLPGVRCEGCGSTTGTAGFHAAR